MTRSAKSLTERMLAIRYEDGAWPLWRVDQSFRYTLKSLVHTHRTVHGEDRDHHAHMADFVAKIAAAPRTQARPTRSVRVGAVGDILWIPGDWSDPFSREVESVLRRFDLRFANLETPVDPTRSVPRFANVRFNAPPRLLDRWNALGGPTLMSLVNNHALDEGLGGLSRTRSSFAARPWLTPLGGDAPDEASASLRVGDISFGVFGVTYGLNPWGHGLPQNAYPPGIPCARFGSARHPTNWDRVRLLVEGARARGPDVVVAMVHWGYEFEHWPDARMRADAYRLVELGVDVVLGTSPHVLQPVEVVSIDGWDSRCPVQLRRGGSPRAALVAFSLGNFTSAMPTDACNAGAILGFSLDVDVEGSLHVHSLEVHGTGSVRCGGIFTRSRRTHLLEELRRSGRRWRGFETHVRRVFGVPEHP